MALLQGAVDAASTQLKQVLAQFEDAEGNLVNVTSARLHDQIMTALSGITDLETKTNTDLQSDINSLLDRLDGMSITPRGPLGVITGPIEITLQPKGK